MPRGNGSSTTPGAQAPNMAPRLLPGGPNRPLISAVMGRGGVVGVAAVSLPERSLTPPGPVNTVSMNEYKF